MRFIISLSIVILCMFSITIVSADNPQNVLQWRGDSADALVNSWGTADLKVISPTGNTVLIYYIKTTRAYNTQWSPAIGVNVSPAGRPVVVAPTMNTFQNQQELSLTCTVKFEVNKAGTIVSTQMQGNGCREGNISP